MRESSSEYQQRDPRNGLDGPDGPQDHSSEEDLLAELGLLEPILERWRARVGEPNADERIRDVLLIDQIGDFEDLASPTGALLGWGGSANVYRVREKATGRPVALKFLRERS